MYSLLLLLLSPWAPATASPTLPSLPEDYAVSIEANIVNKGYTIEVHEWVDIDEGLMRLERRQGDSHAIEIYDYNVMKHYRIVSNDEADDDDDAPATGLTMPKRRWRECVVSNISGTRQARIYDSAKHHLRPTTEAIFQTQTVDFVYGGDNERVRGIRAEIWTGNATMQGFARPSSTGFVPNPPMINYTLTWYIAHKDWSLAAPPRDLSSPAPSTSLHRVPLRAHLKGFEYNSTHTNLRDFEHVYEFTDFYSQDWDRHVFTPPADAGCPHHTHKDMPLLPADFSMRMEVNMLDTRAPIAPPIGGSAAVGMQGGDNSTQHRASGETAELFEAYDWTGNRIRLEQHNWNGTKVQLFLVDQGIQAEYYPAKTSCQWRPLGNGTWGRLQDRSGEWGFSVQGGHLGRSLDVFRDLFTASDSFKYMGQSKARGILCDRWRASIELQGEAVENEATENSLLEIEWFWSVEDWTIRTASRERSVPVRIVLRAPGREHFFEFLDFRPGVPAPSAFDIPAYCQITQSQTKVPKATTSPSVLVIILLVSFSIPVCLAFYCLC